MLIDLSIIIVNWNGMKFLPRCLESLANAPPRVTYRVAVVDNVSTDGSLDWLRSPAARAGFSEGQFRLLESAENIGFGRANNLGIAACPAQFFMLLNPDTIVMPRAIDTLIDVLRGDERIGACGPRLLNPDGSLQPSVWRAPPSALFTLLEGFQLYRLVPQPFRGRIFLGAHWPHSTRRRVKSFSGAAFMVRRQVVEQVGAFNEAIDMYGEEGDWYGRMQRAGWQLAFEPAAEIVHYGGQSTRQRWDDHEQRLRQIEAHLRMQKDHLTPRNAAWNIRATLLVLNVMRLRSRAKGRCTRTLDDAIGLNREYLSRVLSRTSP